MKVLVTGSHGFLGSAFVELLKQRSVPFALYDRAHPENIPEGVDRVVNFAGITPGSAKNISEKQYLAANVESTATLLGVLRGRPLKRFVNIGTCAENGYSKKPLKETSKEKPDNDYGRSKLEQSRLVERFAKETRTPSLNLRIFNVAGIPAQRPRDIDMRRPFIFETLIEQFRRRAKTISVSNARNSRDYTDLSDVMEAVYAATTKKIPKGFTTVNICSGRATTLSELVSYFAGHLHRGGSVKDQSKQVSHSLGDPAKAKKVLGWSAKVSVEESVRRMLTKYKRVLIVGAGVAGELVAKGIEKDAYSDIIVIGYVDDDPKKKNAVVQGVRVLGGVAQIPRIIADGYVDQVLISTPSVGGLVRRITDMVPAGFPIKILPSISSVILGKVDLSYVRDIDPSDIIGRPLVKSDQEVIAKKASGKRFLVTGGAGSIGSEIVRQLYSSGAQEIIIFDSWEEGIFNILEELGRAPTNGTKISAVIGNVRDKERLEEILQQRPDVIVHAAAYKHVPLMEANPREAYKTNELGTQNLLELAVRYGVKDFVLISTDKAVNPSSVMGRSKRAAELLVKEFAKKHKDTRFCAVRFGNVLNSSGSVLPKFLQQIRAREPITITDKSMTRYFMSIPEAVSLVLMAWVVGKSGQILLLDMGAPTKILDLAETLIKLHGLTPNVDIPILETGIRPGEKLHEELSYDPKKLKASPAKRIFIAEDIE